MVGVGRDLDVRSGSGAELYVVIGHAPRHLDRNVALVGRVVKGMELLSGLPRGGAEMGFYTKAEAPLPDLSGLKESGTVEFSDRFFSRRILLALADTSERYFLVSLTGYDWSG